MYDYNDHDNKYYVERDTDTSTCTCTYFLIDVCMKASRNKSRWPKKYGKGISRYEERNT